MREQIAELDARIEQLRDEKRELAHRLQEQEALEQAEERVAQMTDSEKATLIQALSVESETKVNGA